MTTTTSSNPTTTTRTADSNGSHSESSTGATGETRPPIEHMREWLETLHGGLPGDIDLRLIREGSHPSRRALGSIDEVIARAGEVDGQNVYIGCATRVAGQGDGSKANLLATRVLWTDIDCGPNQTHSDAMERLSRFPLRPSIVVNSGGGIHAYWLLSEPYDLTTPNRIEPFEHTLKGLTDALGGDRAATDASRVMRLPGTTNHPNAKKIEAGRTAAPCRIVEIATERVYGFEQFQAYTDQGKTIAGPVGRRCTEVGGREVASDALPTAVQALLDERHPDGSSRNAKLVDRWEGSTAGLSDKSASGQDWAIALLLARLNMSADDIADALAFRRWEHSLPEKPDSYYLRTAERALESIEPDDTDPFSLSWDVEAADDFVSENPSVPDPIPVERLRSSEDRERILSRLMDLGLDESDASNFTSLRDHHPERAVADVAESILLERLSRFGNQPTEAHRQSLRNILRRFASLASGRETGRWAHALDLGCGKTQSIVAFMAALDALALPWPMAVAVEKVEALCTLKRQLDELGVEPREIGLVHAKKFAADRVESAKEHKESDYASEPSVGIEEAKERKLLLITHERLRGLRTNDCEQIAYRGAARPLVVWDEAFISSEARMASATQLAETHTALQRRLAEMPEAKTTDEHRRCVGWVSDVLKLIDAGCERESRRKEGGEANPIETEEIPALPTDGPSSFIGACREVLNHQPSRDGRPLETVRTLAEMAGLKVRLGAFSGHRAALSYVVQVPKDLGNVAVLDASFPLRLLERLDRTIRPPADLDDLEKKRRIKSYEAVTIHHWKHASGRDAITKEFNGRSKKSPATAREVVEVMLSQVKPGEGALTFLFKDKNQQDRFQEKLRQMMRAGGLDPDEMIDVPTGDGETVSRPRWPFLTWGNETGLSDFAYCRHVICCGVLHQNPQRLTAAYLGALRDPCALIDGKKIGELVSSELAHVVYQAAGRGNCRRVVDGEAGEMHLWLPIKNQRLLALLQREMPGVQVIDWHPQHTDEAKQLRWRALAGEIESKLADLPEELTTIKALKKLSGWTRSDGIDPNTFTRALDHVLKEAEWVGWERAAKGRAIVPYGSPEGVSAQSRGDDF